MAMSSGMSSSMATVLLVVALVAGTCASGAQPRVGFNINLNRCNQQGTVVIRRSSADPGINYTLAPGRSVHVNSSAYEFFQPPVTFTFATKGNGSIELPPRDVEILRQLRTALKKIEIRCVGNTSCIELYVTYKPPQHDESQKGMLGRRLCPSSA